MIKTDPVSLANLIGTTADTIKHNGSEQEVQRVEDQDLEGEEGQDEEDDRENQNMTADYDTGKWTHIDTSSEKGQHFVKPDEVLNALLSNMVNLCDLHKCKKTEDELYEIFKKVEVIMPGDPMPKIDPYPNNGHELTTDDIKREEEKKCCTPFKKID